jgi:toxin ParE1/3/4
MSTRRYRLSPQALADLKEIAGYLGQRSSAAASTVLEALQQTFRTLADDPELGERRDDLHPGIRMFVPAKPAQRYVVFYYFRESTLEISDVIHSARDWVGLFAQGER